MSQYTNFLSHSLAWSHTQSVFPHNAYTDDIYNIGMATNNAYAYLHESIDESSAYLSASSWNNPLTPYIPYFLTASNDTDYIQIDNEIIRYTSCSLDTASDPPNIYLVFQNCERGVHGTLPTVHYSGSYIERRHIAQFNNMKSDILYRLEHIIGIDVDNTVSAGYNCKHTFQTESSDNTSILPPFNLSNRLKDEYLTALIRETSIENTGQQLESMIIVNQKCIQESNGTLYGFGGYASHLNCGYFYKVHVHLTIVERDGIYQGCELRYVFPNNTQQSKFNYDFSIYSDDGDNRVLIVDFEEMIPIRNHDIMGDNYLKLYIYADLGESANVTILESGSEYVDDWSRLTITKTPMVYQYVL